MTDRGELDFIDYFMRPQEEQHEFNSLCARLGMLFPETCLAVRISEREEGLEAIYNPCHRIEKDVKKHIFAFPEDEELAVEFCTDLDRAVAKSIAEIGAFDGFGHEHDLYNFVRCLCKRDPLTWGAVRLNLIPVEMRLMPDEQVDEAVLEEMNRKQQARLQDLEDLLISKHIEGYLSFMAKFDWKEPLNEPEEFKSRHAQFIADSHIAALLQAKHPLTPETIFARRDEFYSYTHCPSEVIRSARKAVHTRPNLKDFVEAIFAPSRKRRYKNAMKQFKDSSDLVGRLRNDERFVRLFYAILHEQAGSAMISWNMNGSYVPVEDEIREHDDDVDAAIERVREFYAEMPENYEGKLRNHIPRLLFAVWKKIFELARGESPDLPEIELDKQEGSDLSDLMRKKQVSKILKVWELLRQKRFGAGDFEYSDFLMESLARAHLSTCLYYDSELLNMLKSINPSHAEGYFSSHQYMEYVDSGPANGIGFPKNTFLRKDSSFSLYANLAVSTESIYVPNNLGKALDCLTCVLGPDGEFKKAAILYDLDPHVGVLRLIYTNKQENQLSLSDQDNAIGFAPVFQVYNDQEEFCWLVDSVDVGVLAELSQEVWKDVYFKGIMAAARDCPSERRPCRVYFNDFVRNRNSVQFTKHLKERAGEAKEVQLSKVGGNRALRDAGVPQPEHFLEAFQYRGMKEDGTDKRPGTMWLKDNPDGSPKTYKARVIEVRLE